MALGYWENKILTNGVFNAYIKEGQGLYIRTGDLGFVVDGELFFYGRLKDLIIIRSESYSPDDIE